MLNEIETGNYENKGIRLLYFAASPFHRFNVCLWVRLCNDLSHRYPWSIVVTLAGDKELGSLRAQRLFNILVTAGNIATLPAA